MANVPITYGQGQASIAGETIGTTTYQVIKVVGGEAGSTSVMGVNPDRSINVSVLGTPTTLQLAGSIAAVSGTVVAPAGSVIAVTGAVTAPAGSVMTVAQLAGSVLAVSGTFTPAANQSVSGAVTAPPGSVTQVRTDIASVITVQLPGSILATSATLTPGSVSGAVTAPPGSVMTVATLAGSVMAVSGTVTAPAGSIATGVSPAGSVTAVRTDLASVITVQLPGSVLATSATLTPGSVSGAITAPPGSVMAVRTDNASVITVSTNVGSVIATLQAASIVGTYAEDAAHGSADKGLFVLGVRNDLMASVTGADLDYSPMTVGPVGENIIANAPINKWLSGTVDHRITLGASVQALAAQGTSVFTYVTAVQVANMGPASVLVTIAGGLGSILGYTIAPAGGGSNIVYPNPLRTGENSKVTTSISGIASVLVSMQGFSAKI